MNVTKLWFHSFQSHPNQTSFVPKYVCSSYYTMLLTVVDYNLGVPLPYQANKFQENRLISHNATHAAKNGIPKILILKENQEGS